MTFARHLTLLLLACSSLPALAQDAAAPSQTPAPVVRRPPPPNADSAPRATQPHLMVSHPAVHQATPTDPNAPASVSSAAANSAAAKPATPKPAVKPGDAISRLPTEPISRSLVMLDPGHGGGDSGARMNDQLVEKDVTLALAFRLRSLLTARGFTVIMTRDSDTSDTGAPLSLDDRAGIMNHGHPVACLLLHATASGRGVHIYTSELEPTPNEVLPAPWLTAQAPWSGQSQKLAAQIGTALGRAKIPPVVSRASVRPVDSLTCPALVLELAPNSSDAASLGDEHYQEHVAEALTGALVFWQNQAQPPTRPVPPVTASTPISPGEVHP